MPAAARPRQRRKVSRLCTKPWRPDELRQSILEAIHQNSVLRENRRLRTLADQQGGAGWSSGTVARSTGGERHQRPGPTRTRRSMRSLLDSVRLLHLLEQRLPDQASAGGGWVVFRADWRSAPWCVPMKSAKSRWRR